MKIKVLNKKSLIKSLLAFIILNNILSNYNYIYNVYANTSPISDITPYIIEEIINSDESNLSTTSNSIGNNFIDGVLWTIQGDTFALIDEENNILIPPQYEDVTIFSDGLAWVKKDDAWGLIDKENNIILPFDYNHNSNISPSIFSSGLSAIQVDDMWGYINKHGDTVIEPMFISALEFIDNQASVSIQDPDNQDSITSYIIQNPLQYELDLFTNFNTPEQRIDYLTQQLNQLNSLQLTSSSPENINIIQEFILLSLEICEPLQIEVNKNDIYIQQDDFQDILDNYIIIHDQILDIYDMLDTYIPDELSNKLSLLQKGLINPIQDGEPFDAPNLVAYNVIAEKFLEFDKDEISNFSSTSDFYDYLEEKLNIISNSDNTNTSDSIDGDTDTPIDGDSNTDTPIDGDTPVASTEDTEINKRDIEEIENYLNTINDNMPIETIETNDNLVSLSQDKFKNLLGEMSNFYDDVLNLIKDYDINLNKEHEHTLNIALMDLNLDDTINFVITSDMVEDFKNHSYIRFIFDELGTNIVLDVQNVVDIFENFNEVQDDVIMTDDIIIAEDLINGLSDSDDDSSDDDVSSDDDTDDDSSDNDVSSDDDTDDDSSDDDVSSDDITDDDSSDNNITSDDITDDDSSDNNITSDDDTDDDSSDNDITSDDDTDDDSSDNNITSDDITDDDSSDNQVDDSTTEEFKYFQDLQSYQNFEESNTIEFSLKYNKNNVMFNANTPDLSLYITTPFYVDDSNQNSNYIANPEDITIIANINGEFLNWGGQVNSSNNTIEFLATSAGSYQVQVTETIINDIDHLDEQLQHIVKFMVSKEFFNTINDNFYPNGLMTRYDFISSLVKVFFVQDNTLVSKFDDIDASNPYHNIVAAAENGNITKGYQDNTFRGDILVTRETLISFVGRVLGEQLGYTYPENVDDTLSIFQDYEDISAWAKNDISLALSHGVIKIDDNFYPQQEITRIEALEIVYNLFAMLYVVPNDDIFANIANTFKNNSNLNKDLLIGIGAGVLGMGLLSFIFRKKP